MVRFDDFLSYGYIGLLVSTVAVNDTLVLSREPFLPLFLFEYCSHRPRRGVRSSARRRVLFWCIPKESDLCFGSSASESFLFGTMSQDFSKGGKRSISRKISAFRQSRGYLPAPLLREYNG